MNAVILGIVWTALMVGQQPLMPAPELPNPPGLAQAPTPNLDVIRGALSRRHRFMRRIRDPRHQLAEFFVQRRRIGVQGGDPVAQFAHSQLQLSRVRAGLFQFADFLRLGIALRLQFFRFHQRATPLAIQLAERLHVDGESAIRQPRCKSAHSR